MFQPEYIFPLSCVQGRTEVNGDISYAEKLRERSNELAKTTDLYTAQEKVKQEVIAKHGLDFYEKNGDAINFIVENAFCNMERSKYPAIDRDIQTELETSTVLW